MLDAGEWIVVLAVWILPVFILIGAAWAQPDRTAGLLIAYVANLWLIHWPAAGIQALPWMHSLSPVETLAGFQLSLLGVWAFTIGGLILAPLTLSLFESSRAAAVAPAPREPSARVPGLYLALGVMAFLALPIAGAVIPGIAAVGSGVTLLVVVGLALKAWTAYHHGNTARQLLWLGAGAVLPLLTLVSRGFVSFGAAAFISLAALTLVYVRPRWRLLAGMLLVGYVGFSFYVTYMRDRGAIRSVVWGGGAVAERLGTLSNLATDFEWFDPTDLTHLRRIDARLNQNFLVGASVAHMEAGLAHPAVGETLWLAAIAAIPRAIWPEKPSAGGSGDLVTRFTGIPFAEGTSVGIGQVMEFYVNFGVPGVAIGFLLFGLALGVIDTVAGRRLWRGDWEGYAVVLVVGLATIQPGGAIVEVVASAFGGLVGVLAINRLALPAMLRYLEPGAAPARVSAPAAEEGT
ncbi:MAG: hypothetical protein WEB88_01970 [Gemmatimonadota bacterium]